MNYYNITQCRSVLKIPVTLDVDEQGRKIGFPIAGCVDVLQEGWCELREETNGRARDEIKKRQSGAANVDSKSATLESERKRDNEGEPSPSPFLACRPIFSLFFDGSGVESVRPAPDNGRRRRTRKLQLWFYTPSLSQYR